MRQTDSTQGMVMRYPATRWQDALPTGSGVVGALVYGTIQNEQVVLNHDALYYPHEKRQSLDVSDQVPAMRERIRAGKCREAAQLMRDVYAERLAAADGSKGSTLDPYQPFCTLFLGTGTDGPFRHYRRGVDFRSGRAWVRWEDNVGTFTRETFVSRATDTVWLKFGSNQPGAISCRLSLQKTVSEQLDPRDICHASAGTIDLETKHCIRQEEAALVFEGRYGNGLAFGAVGVVHHVGGTIGIADDALLVEGADELTVKIRLFVAEDPAEAVPRLVGELTGAGAGYDEALAEHSGLHGALFERVTLNLGQAGKESNEEMLMAAYEGEVSSSLLQTMFDFGRYLLISSSRQGGWPANLQGIWNGDYAPAWNCDIHTDENVQMNYWPALPGGLAETALPLFDYFEAHLNDFRKNARNNWGCRGIMVPLALTTDGISTPRGYVNWTAGAGWIAQHFYDYYLFTGDRAFLKDRVVPFLKEIALFYEDFLIDGDDGRLTYMPSLSPENRPANGNSLVTIDATMDIAICREVLSNLCDACKTLGIEAEGVARWQSMLSRLPAYAVNEEGALCEWIHPGFEDNYHHRHQSHLYPIFPGLEVTKESNPAIFEAGRVAVEKRLVIGLTSQTGWSMAHMANTYARLGQGDRALECLELLTRGSTGPNLFTYHNDWRRMGLTCGGDSQPPFQIDANFGITAAILEMLVYSKPGLVKLLPALPSRWPAGEVQGICCRGGISVNMKWSRPSLEATLTSQVDQTVRVCLPEWFGDAKRDREMVLKKDLPVSLTIQSEDRS